MSLKPQPIQPVPEMTAEVARAAFPKGNPYLKFRDKLETIFTDDDFADLYPIKGQPATAPWRLAFITILQYRENLSDRAAADSVRARVDWKYLLGLELTDSGFDFSVHGEKPDPPNHSGVRLKAKEELSRADNAIESPYNPEARFRRRRLI